MCVINLLWLFVIIASLECAILDPAMYLSPNPPLKETSKDISPAKLWSLPIDKRTERDAEDSSVPSIENDPAKEYKEESMRPSETFWPLFRNVDYGVRGIHIPLTFSVSGIYGNYDPGVGVGVISSSYGTVTGLTKLVKNSGKTALAGTGYGAYQSRYPGIRIYGTDHEPAWGGWGNGKWGHYGKG